MVRFDKCSISRSNAIDFGKVCVCQTLRRERSYSAHTCQDAIDHLWNRIDSETVDNVVDVIENGCLCPGSSQCCSFPNSIE